MGSGEKSTHLSAEIFDSLRSCYIFNSDSANLELYQPLTSTEKWEMDLYNISGRGLNCQWNAQ